MWLTFAGITGGAGGGLTSLTFLVVAFRYDTIAVSQEYRSRAAQTLSLFLTITIVAVLFAVPQPIQALGIELLLVALGSAVTLKFVGSIARKVQTTKPTIAFSVAMIIFVTCIAMCGLLLLLDLDWGRYFYVVSSIVGLTSGIYGSWLFLTQAGRENTDRSSAPDE